MILPGPGEITINGVRHKTVSRENMNSLDEIYVVRYTDGTLLGRPAITSFNLVDIRGANSLRVCLAQPSLII